METDFETFAYLKTGLSEFEWNQIGVSQPKLASFKTMDWATHERLMEQSLREHAEIWKALAKR